MKRVLQQQADLNHQSGSLQSRSLLAMALRRLQILNYPFSVAHWGRLQKTGPSFVRCRSLDSFTVLLLLSLIVQYVKDYMYVHDPEDGVLKTIWLCIPYVVAISVTMRTIEADYIRRDFRILYELILLGFLYFLGYCFQSYL